MIIRANPAEYCVHVGGLTHTACATHTTGIVSLARMAQVPVNIRELHPGHEWECEVCDVIASVRVPCH